MKALFGRKQSEKQPSATSRTLNEAYKIWLPRPELPRQRTTSGSAARPPDVQHQTRHPPPTAAAYRPQYYTGAGASTPVVQPPQQLPPRPDSRASYVQYNPVYAQPYPQQRVPAPVSAPPPVAGSSKQPRPRREGSTSSLTLKRGDAAAEPKKSSKHHRSKDKEAAAPPPEVRKRKDSSSRDKERDKDRVASRKREDKERERDRMREKDKEKERRRREEAEYSDARPSSRAAKLFQRLEETKKGKPPDRTRTGIPTQPTTGSSSSGKQTPQIPRMPIYLPTSKSQRDNGLSESDTDNPLSRGRSTLPKSFSKTVTVPLPSPTENKVKESKSSFWSFRTRSSQKFAQPVPVTTSSRKPRADSTPPQPVPTTTERPHRRYASDSTIGAKPDRDSRLMATELRPTTSADRSGSRTMAFATQPDRSSHAFPQPQPAQPQPQPNPARSSAYEPPPPAAAAQPRATFTWPAPIPRPETPSQRPQPPPIYAPSRSVNQSSNSMPKVSTIVAGHEARTWDKTASKLERRPSLSRIYAAPAPPVRSQQQQQPEVWVPPANIYATPSQPSVPMAAAIAGRVGPAAAAEPTQARGSKQPEMLQSQLRDLLSERPQPPTARPSAPMPGVHSSSSSRQQEHPHQAAAPVVSGAAVATVATSKKTDKPVEAPTGASSSKRTRSAQPDVADAPPRASSSRNKDEGRDRDRDRERDKPSRSRKEPVVVSAVMKTPSKEGTTKHSSSSRDLHVGKTPSSRDQATAMAMYVTKTPSKESSRQTHTPSPQHSTPPRISASERPPSRAQAIPSTTSTTHAHVSSRSSREPQPSSKHSLPHTSPAAAFVAFTPSDRTARPVVQPQAPPQTTYDHTALRPPSRANAVPPPAQPQTPSQATYDHTALRPPSRANAVSPSAQPPPVVQQQQQQTVASSSRQHVPRMPSEESILKTPSSLAHSVLHPTVSRSSMSSEIKKKGILNMFRSPAPAPRMEREVSASDGEYMDRPRRSKQHIPAPINIPANGTVPISERKSPNARVFTPFRILSNKRRRRVSTASMDAVNGTAPNTVMGSPTASMQSSQFPSQPPPHRDPMTATHDWRNHAETKVNIIGKARRMRPGVVFDTPEDPMEESRPKLRGRRTSGGSASASDGQGTDSSE